MKKYSDLITQTFDFPTKEFKVENGQLSFNEVPLMELIEKYGTPLKISYLPKIRQQIQKAYSVFNQAIEKLDYEGKYIYAYCTKSNHFKFVMETVLGEGCKLETSSAYDINIIRRLYESGLISKDILIVCNGFKPDNYKKAIVDLINDGFHNCIPVLDNIEEIDYYLENAEQKINVGIRVAADEEPDFEVYTSRLGIRYSRVLKLYEEKIKNSDKVDLKLIHYFINSGIKDTQYYWNELNKFITKYTELRSICDTIDSVDIGGGFPIKYSLTYEYDHAYMAEAIVEIIQSICKQAGVSCPHIVSEFGSYTVGESGATIYSILEKKQQNDKELWYIIDGSLITHIPDTWGKNHKFVMLAVNNWDNDYTQVHIGGITCDSDDYYNSETHSANIYLPDFDKMKEEKQYIGFFHTGAYQEALAGYGGTSHCLIPDPKHVIVDHDGMGGFTYKVYREQQKPEQMLEILGY
ncbi:arginine decarboxylase [Limibacter armeniacum]|uniref:arginine decarboxylase n=1 Tax=Limibacter armeniacum TaxID=466084 RepID=UPI002FE516F1